MSKLYLKDIFSEEELAKLEDIAKKMNMTLQELVIEALEKLAEDFGHKVPSKKP